MTAIAITGMGLTGSLRITWVQDSLAHVLDQSHTDETSGTWTGLACPRHDLALGTDVDNATLQRLAAGSEIADLVWEAPEELTTEHTQVFQAAMRAHHAGESERANPVRARQAPALGGRLLRAPHQPSWPSPPPYPQHRGRQFDRSGAHALTVCGYIAER